MCVRWGKAWVFKHLLPSAPATDLCQIVITLTLLSDNDHINHSLCQTVIKLTLLTDNDHANPSL